MKNWPYVIRGAITTLCISSPYATNIDGKIYTEQHKVTIDTGDLERLIGFRVSVSKKQTGSYYARVNIPGYSYLHRFILACEPGTMVDHVNRLTLDNRKSNLRLTNHTLNAYNRDLLASNSSGITGVSWYPAKKRWFVQVSGVYLGVYVTKEEAEQVALSFRADIAASFNLN